jgi:glycosyltransferase involved in cell wall biosynthesis
MSGSLQLACAFGKPVVCADSGGLSEVVNQDKNGILVRANDSFALSEGILRLLADDKLRQRMGAESLRMAREDFSWAKIASATVKVYQELLRG